MAHKVLVVEDDPTVAEVVVEYLRHAGLEPHHVADGALALATFDQVRPDLVVLDVMLPGLAASPNGTATVSAAPNRSGMVRMVRYSHPDPPPGLVPGELNRQRRPARGPGRPS